MDTPFSAAETEEKGASERRKTLALSMALAAALTLAFAVFLTANSETWAAKTVGDVAQLTASALAAAACFHAARRQPSCRRAWLLLGMSSTVWATAAGIWLAYGLTRDHVYPFPSVADVGFLGYSLLAVVGLLLFPLDRAGLVSRFRTILDASTIASAVFFISWATVLGPVFRASADPLTRFVAVAYPAMDIVIVSLVLALALAMRQRPGTRVPFAASAVAHTTVRTRASCRKRRPTASSPLQSRVVMAAYPVQRAAVAVPITSPAANFARPMR